MSLIYLIQKGFEKAVEMLEIGKERKSLQEAPELMHWLKSLVSSGLGRWVRSNGERIAANGDFGRKKRIMVALNNVVKNNIPKGE